MADPHDTPLLSRDELLALSTDQLVEKVLGLRQDLADDAETIAALTAERDAAHAAHAALAAAVREEREAREECDASEPSPSSTSRSAHALYAANQRALAAAVERTDALLSGAPAGMVRADVVRAYLDALDEPTWDERSLVALDVARTALDAALAAGTGWPVVELVAPGEATTAERLAQAIAERDYWREQAAGMAPSVDGMRALCTRLFPGGTGCIVDPERVVAAVAALRAIIAGRTVAPSDEEIAAHAAAGGSWLVRYRRDETTTTRVGWHPLDATGRPTTWPTGGGP